MNTKTLTAIALLIAAVPAASFAQSGPMAGMTPPTLDFATADADGSGGISAEEWTAYSATLHSEMRAQRTAARADALIAEADADGDGALTRDELITGMTAMGDARRESRGGMGRGHGERHGMRGDHGGWGGHHMRGDDDHGRRGEMRDGQRGGQRDGQRDGQRGEMRGERGGDMASRSFARMDRNDDGSIDATELGQAQEFLNWMAQRPRFN